MSTLITDVEFVVPVRFYLFGGTIAGGTPEGWSAWIEDPELSASILLTEDKTGNALRIPTSNVRQYVVATKPKATALRAKARARRSVAKPARSR